MRNLSKLSVLVLVLIISISGCKSKKKAMEASNAREKARLEQEVADRKKQEEELKRREAEETARRDAELKLREEELKASAPRTRLSQYFEAIANSANIASANSSINEALTLFASPDTPVFIVISEYDGKKDYDRPTTIKNYLHYLKDQKKNINSISSLKTDNSGKITEVELRKN